MLKPMALAAIGFFALCGSVQAQNWELDSSVSEVSFGSIKRDFAGEVHRFDSVSGSVSEDGNVEVNIDLTSVNTNVDLRNSRMIEYVFGSYTSAAIRTQIDMDRLGQLPVGGTEIFSIFGTLEFLGKEHNLQLDVVVARLSDLRVMVNTRNMIFLNAEDMGITDSLAKLADLAGLPQISGAVPVTLRFVFDGQGAVAAATQVQVASANAQEVRSSSTLAAQGNAQRGIKVYMKCFACHSVKEGRHGTGPSLHNVLGRPAGTQEGYQYSDALAGAGFPWTEDELANYLTNPAAYIPGTSMAFEGLYEQGDIQDLLAYLAAQ
ncbi:YceI family protein [Actibacterium pelagium]|uniref:Cytochrome c domain-containing protein n=1 Tax=Actibacterium pelagium TaxID=2029103 RepID=A0A917AM99_9RHOB|nr:YceI family protein [Actibacterium pelagium]GGE61066.1 hypothetical protein GCM10011517_30790 [Actibacterium pelagium]